MRSRTTFLCTILALLLARSANGRLPRPQQPPTNKGAGVACRALEVHIDESSHVAAVVFHQASESSREPLAALLRDHPASAVDLELEGQPDKTWHGTVFRLKSCFGRGLLLLPESSATKEGAVFHLRLSAP